MLFLFLPFQVLGLDDAAVDHGDPDPVALGIALLVPDRGRAYDIVVDVELLVSGDRSNGRIGAGGRVDSRVPTRLRS